MWYWYLKYRPIPQFWPNVRCTAHGPSFARVRYVHTHLVRATFADSAEQVLDAKCTRPFLLLVKVWHPDEQLLYTSCWLCGIICLGFFNDCQRTHSLECWVALHDLIHVSIQSLAHWASYIPHFVLQCKSWTQGSFIVAVRYWKII